MNVEALIRECEKNDGCDRCSKKVECHKFTQLIKQVTEPWEFPQFLKDLKEM